LDEDGPVTVGLIGLDREVEQHIALELAVEPQGSSRPPRWSSR
jgi:hypothetical protein